jgi:hypothetical protein
MGILVLIAEMSTDGVQVLRDHGLLTPSEDADLVQRICGILDVNSFEVRGPPSKSGESERLRGVYLRAALMAHDCVANTHLAVDDDFQMIIHASVPIPRGHPIYFNYTSAMQVYRQPSQLIKHCIAGQYVCLKNGVFWVVTPCGSCKN